MTKRLHVLALFAVSVAARGGDFSSAPYYLIRPDNEAIAVGFPI
jgi:hypothetical protein